MTFGGVTVYGRTDCLLLTKWYKYTRPPLIHEAHGQEVDRAEIVPLANTGYARTRGCRIDFMRHRIF